MKKQIIRQLQKLRKVSRKKHHILQHKLHKEHKLSRKTLFYIKEYTTEKKVISTILKESLKILIFASIISSFGGFGLEGIKTLFVSIIPLVILMPALNDMIGDYGTIIASRFSTMLHEGKIKKSIFQIDELRKLFIKVLTISMLTTIMAFIISLIVAYLTKNYAFTFIGGLKIFTIVIIDALLLIAILFTITIIMGLYLFKKEEDPSNFLIPIATSIADFGNMLILAGLVLLFF